MKLTITIEDTQKGVKVDSSQSLNGTTDNPSISLTALWAANLWLYMLGIQKGAGLTVQGLSELKG